MTRISEGVTLALVALLAMLSVAVVVDSAPSEPPVLAFRPTGDRSLIAVNNPEQLWPSDFADPALGNVVLLRSEDVRGKVRNWWELYNRAGFPASYGVVAYNPHPNKTVVVTVTGRGFTPTVEGGLPFVRLMNNPIRETIRVPPLKWVWLMHEDYSIPNEAIFSGAIDFEITSAIAGEEAPPVQVLNFIYRDFLAMQQVDMGCIPYMGYITRKEKDGENEARVYKGTTSHMVRTAPNMDFTIDDLSTYLPVRYPFYNFTSGTYGPLQKSTRWISNIGSNNVPDAVMSDMAAFYTPGWGFIDPFYKSDAAGMYPNSGNYGIEYRIEGTITNVGSQTRNVTFNIQVPTNCPLLSIAYETRPGVWAADYVTSASVVVTYLSIAVPATNRPVAYSAKYVVGGPACGNLANWVQVLS